MFKVESVKEPYTTMYRADYDEDVRKWSVDTVQVTEDKVTIIREFDKKDCHALLEYLCYEGKDEAEAASDILQYEDRFNLMHLEDIEIHRAIYNYIKNNDLQDKGFVYITPFDVWTHTDYMESKIFEYGDLSYVAAEVAANRGKKGVVDCIGMFYPFKTENDNDSHAHSFEEVLAVCVKAKEFEPLDIENSYSRQQIAVLKFIREAQHGKAWK